MTPDILGRKCDKHGTPLEQREAGHGYKSIICQKCIDEEIKGFIPQKVIAVRAPVSREETIEWLIDRYNNCTRIAAQKPPGDDRMGWEVDAEYFANAIAYLSAGVTNRQS